MWRDTKLLEGLKSKIPTLKYKINKNLHCFLFINIQPMDHGRIMILDPYYIISIALFKI